MNNPPSNSEVCPTCGRFYTTYITHGSAQPPTPECSDPFHAGDSQLTDQGVRERLRDVVFAEVKSRVFHAAETKSSILEHHAQMVWKRIEPYLDQISAEREKKARVDEVGKYGQWLIAHAEIPDARTLMQYKVDRLAALRQPTGDER